MNATNTNKTVNGWPIFVFEGTPQEIDMLLHVYTGGETDAWKTYDAKIGPRNRASVELDIVWGEHEGCPNTAELSAQSLIDDATEALA